MQPWRPPTAVEDWHPAILTRDVVSVNYFSLFSRVVVQVTESSAFKEEGTSLLSKRWDKRNQRHTAKSKKIWIICEYNILFYILLYNIYNIYYIYIIPANKADSFLKCNTTHIIIICKKSQINLSSPFLWQEIWCFTYLVGIYVKIALHNQFT
jgi:hypothetical protein